MKLTPTNAFIGLLIVALLAVGYGLWTRRRKDDTVTVDDMAGMVNIAPLASLTTSSTMPDFTNPKAILADLLPASYAWGGSGWNDATRSTFPDWVVLEWPTSVKIGQVTVTALAGKDGEGNYKPGSGATGGNLGLKDYVVQIWNGVDWQTVSTVAGNDKDQVVSNLASVVTTQKLRVYITASQDGTWSRIAQIQVKGKVA